MPQDHTEKLLTLAWVRVYSLGVIALKQNDIALTSWCLPKFGIKWHHQRVMSQHTDLSNGVLWAANDMIHGSHGMGNNFIVHKQR